MRVYEQRKTSKVLAKEPLTGELSSADLHDLIDAAAWSPFHYAASAEHRSQLADNSPEPWRFYVLNRDRCLEVRQHLIVSDDMSKVPDMLAGADALIQVTWCPNPAPEDFGSTEETPFYPSSTNMEHIAATAAAIQNTILCATEKGIPSYWSSGGPLRKQGVFSLLGIPSNQVLLGSVFLFPKNVENLEDGDKVKIVPGKMRDKRSQSRSWNITVEKLLS